MPSTSALGMLVVASLLSACPAHVAGRARDDREDREAPNRREHPSEERHVVSDRFTTTETPANRRNLIVNGGFEAPQLERGTWTLTPAIPGWASANAAPIELQNGAVGAPVEGAQLCELDSSAPSRLYQDVVGTEANRPYILAFSYSARPGTDATDNVMEVIWDGHPIARVTADGAGATRTQWREYSYRVSATTSTTRLEFRDLGVANGLGNYLDDVRLVAL